MKEFYAFSSKVFLCLAASIMLSQAGMAQTYYTETAQSISTSSNSGGFYEFLPPGYNTGSQTYPLMIFLHGAGELGNGGSQLSLVLANGPPKLLHAKTLPGSFTVNGQTFSFIVLAPQFRDMAQPNEVDALITYAVQHYRVNADRIYLTGLSLGGGSAWYYPALNDTYCKRIAALLPVCGDGVIDPGDGQRYATNHLPVYATHNSGDPTVDPQWTIGCVDRINASTSPPANPRAIATIFNASGHDAWTHTYDPGFLNPDINNLNAYQWMLQYSRGTILPVTLGAYNATLSADQAQVTVSWTTTMEENNRYFIVQRSGDGQQFADLDTVTDANATTGHAYTYTDQSPLPGNNLYRLAQVDLDGKTTLFRVLSVNVSAETRPSFRLGPNPADNTLYLKFVQPGQSTLGVSLSDVGGKILRSWKFQKQGTAWDQSIDLSNLPAGSYFIRLQSGNYKTVQQFIKK
ncbi:MAG TPA: T9SS type A sorting domain-containing protein [Puia sp.]|nr:T9SS type A sorting domain-containing protein [Puia sp.]